MGTIITNKQVQGKLTSKTGVKALDGESAEGAYRDGILHVHSEDLWIFSTGDIQITLIGGVSVQDVNRMWANIRIEQKNGSDTILLLDDRLDLLSPRQEQLVRNLATKLCTPPTSAKRIIDSLKEKITGYRITRLLKKETGPVAPEISPEAQQNAKEYLKRPKLLESITSDFQKTGIFQENMALLIYLCFLSRQINQPIPLIFLGQSPEENQYRLGQVLKLFPEEEITELTGFSPQSFSYTTQEKMLNKLFVLWNYDNLTKQGKTSIQEIITNKKITRLAVQKDIKRNKLETSLQTVFTKSAIVIPTSSPDTGKQINGLTIAFEPSANDMEQKMQYQAMLSAGLINMQQEKQVSDLFQNIQRLLKPMVVKNSFARQMIFPDTMPRCYELYSILLRLCETITLLHQHQRKQQSDPLTGGIYIETSREDALWALKLLKPCFVQMTDVLSHLDRQFLTNLKIFLQTQSKETFYTSDLVGVDGFYNNRSSVRRKLGELALKGCIEELAENDSITNNKQGFQYRLNKQSDKGNLKTEKIINELISHFSVAQGGDATEEPLVSEGLRHL